MESQLQGKRLRWLGHVFKVPKDRLLMELLFGLVQGLRPPECPRSSFNDVALHDCQTSWIGRPIEMRKTDNCGETRLVPHVPSSS